MFGILISPILKGGTFLAKKLSSTVLWGVRLKHISICDRTYGFWAQGRKRAKYEIYVLVVFCLVMAIICIQMPNE